MYPRGDSGSLAAADGQDSLIKNEVGVKTYVSARAALGTAKSVMVTCFDMFYWARRPGIHSTRTEMRLDPSLGPVIIELIKITLLSTAIAPGCSHVCGAIPCGHFVSKCFI